MEKSKLTISLFLFHLCLITVESTCQETCNLALASYYVSPGTTLLQISNYFNNSTLLVDEIVSYNHDIIRNQDTLPSNTRIDVPFPCGCVNDTFLGHVFAYQFQRGDTYENVANYNYTNLTSASWIERFNVYNPVNVPDGGIVNIPINCSCGDRSVSREYGLFITYPLQEGESLRSISEEFNLTESLLQGYNPGVNFSAGSGLVYIPGRDQNGNYPPLILSDSEGSGLSAGAIAGICVAAVVLIILFVGFYLIWRRTKLIKVLSQKTGYKLTQSNSISKPRESASDSGKRIGNSVEFSYEELAKATDNFNSSYQIGAGGFGVVYFGELRGQKAAIKKMDMEASREFLAELKVLTRVHHLHLVRLLGYCVQGSLFLIYEYIDNGNLSQHLRGSARDPLPWSIRVQIALDAAKGLEYIHEHTDPVYIHRDIKPANILISQNFQAKVADFGLTKLAEVGNSTLPTRLVGTFGYMPPEYAQYGEVSPKVDVYAFGVVLYELISAKAAVVREHKGVVESKGLVALFEDALNLPDPNEICKMIDPRLGDDYPLDAVRQMAELAKACTHDNPELRPNMRSVVVALTTLSSNTGNWDADSLYRNIDIINQLSGR